MVYNLPMGLVQLINEPFCVLMMISVHRSKFVQTTNLLPQVTLAASTVQKIRDHTAYGLVQLKDFVVTV